MFSANHDNQNSVLSRRNLTLAFAAVASGCAAATALFFLQRRRQQEQQQNRANPDHTAQQLAAAPAPPPSSLHTGTVSQILIFPLKGGQPIVLDKNGSNDGVLTSWPLCDTGFKYDREWLLLDAETKECISSKDLPIISTIRATILFGDEDNGEDGSIEFSLPLCDRHNTNSPLLMRHGIRSDAHHQSFSGRGSSDVPNDDENANSITSIKEKEDSNSTPSWNCPSQDTLVASPVSASAGECLNSIRLSLAMPKSEQIFATKAEAKKNNSPFYVIPGVDRLGAKGDVLHLDAGADAFFSEYLGKRVLLCRTYTKRAPSDVLKHRGSGVRDRDRINYHIFGHLHFVSSSSMSWLQDKLNIASRKRDDSSAVEVTAVRLRANVVVDGVPNDEIDHWRTIVVEPKKETTTKATAENGGVRLRFGRYCNRCPVPTIDPSTGVLDKHFEPTKTIMDQRAAMHPHQQEMKAQNVPDAIEPVFYPMFGNLFFIDDPSSTTSGGVGSGKIKQPQRIALGDQVRVVETGPGLAFKRSNKQQ